MNNFEFLISMIDSGKPSDEICNAMRGRCVYFPKVPKDERDLRNEQIRAYYLTHECTYQDIADLFHLSVSQIKRIMEKY